MIQDDKAGVITPAAQAILEKRYFQEGETTAEQLFRRVANAIGENDDERERFFHLMNSLDFLPNSPTLMNAGTKEGTLSACFVLPVEDSMVDITDASYVQAMVQKFGGGTGFSLSELRPKGDPVSTTHGKACGPVAVLKYLSATSTLVTQGGKRDGANMAVLRVDHPDIMEFITCKQTEGDIHNFNISVGATDEFMDAVKHDRLFELEFMGNIYKRLPARDIWNVIIDNAWRNGEPGMVFLDTINQGHPGLSLGEIQATNPCGEQPLLPYESCNLGSINLLNFVDVELQDFDWRRLAIAVDLAVRFLDNTITANEYAEERIEHANLKTRKIGLGVMGWADALSKLWIPYDSGEAFTLATKVMRYIADIAEQASIALGKEKGPYFAWNSDIYDPPLPDRRNLCLTSIAPTGTISMIAGVSSGIEPHFALAWRKQNILEGESFDFVNQVFEDAAIECAYERAALESAFNGTLQENEDIPLKFREAFKTASDISWDAHVSMQASFQEFVDSGVSKTINLHNTASVSEVGEAYIAAFERVCKGITVYRQGSRDKEVLVAASDKDTSPLPSGYKRPQTLEGETVRITTGRGKAYITLNELGGELREVLVVHGKAGGNDSAMAQALSRLIGVSLQHGVSPDEIYKQLIGITDIPVWDNGKRILSLPDGIGQAIQQWYAPVDEFLDEVYEARGTECRDCRNQLAMIEGCIKCLYCGWSQC